MNDTIQEFSPSGQDLGIFASTGLNVPIGLAFDASGDLFAANHSGGSIREFSPSGQDLGNFATGLNLPTFIAIPSVPEPSSLTLLGLGLAGLSLAWARHFVLATGGD
jgi:hypothetical protein